MTHLQQQPDAVRVKLRDADHRVVVGDPSASFHTTAKRLYDLAFSLGALVVLSPLFLLIAALIKIADGGDVFYWQIRDGVWGRAFCICTFRTMISTAEQAGLAVTKHGDARL